MGLWALGPGMDDVPLGASGTRDFKIVNAGNIAMTITKAKVP